MNLQVHHDGGTMVYAMGEHSNTEFPYKSLGTWLRRMRLKKQETLAEVSGAVEIEVTKLADMEKGVRRPTEDILMLLISYFSVGEEEAVSLWELAGYDMPADDDDHHHETPPITTLQPIMILPIDARIVYTDNAQVDVNQHGVVLNFLQASGAPDKVLPVSRVGMSHEHAQRLLASLQYALAPKQQKMLPSQTDLKKPTDPPESQNQ